MKEPQAAESGEDRLIARYFKPLATHPGAFGLLDDAAAIAPPPGCDLVLKTDGVVAGMHFFPDDPPDTVARKALRVNLSDLAAKGASPLGFLLTLVLPPEIGDAWLAPFARGLGADAAHFACPLFGGDTDRTTGPITISIAMLGAVPHDKMVRRAGARLGDRVVVTGTIGDAALGLILRRERAAVARWGLTQDQQDHLMRRYLVPEPRIAIAEALRAHASAAMDVSDGLAGDLAKLCRVSGVAADIEVVRVPLSDAARAALAKEPALIETIVAGGDDYEVLACVPPDKLEALRRQATAAGVAITDIGTVAAGHGQARFVDARGQPLALAHPSFSHF
jgi:thiamine-monophosphate kinase